MSAKVVGATVWHVCGEDCGRYTCPGCERSIPNCVGAHDELAELCDDCAVKTWEAREQAALENL